jgi:type IV secretion system protein VirD4
MAYYKQTTVGFTMEPKESSQSLTREKMVELYRQVETNKYATPVQALLLLDEIVSNLFSQLFWLWSENKTEQIVFTEMLYFLRTKQKIPNLISLMAESVHVLGSSAMHKDSKSINQTVDSALHLVKVILDWYENQKDKQYESEYLQDWCEALSSLASIEEDQFYTPPGFANVAELEKYAGKDGLVISKQLRLKEPKSFEHCLVLGPTGSGKTTSFFIPNLLELPNATIIVTDPKGELFEKTAYENRRQGKKIMHFNPFDERTKRYNPLHYCKSTTDVWQLAQTILINGANAVGAQQSNSSRSNDEWINMSVPLFASMLLYAKSRNETIELAIDRILEFSLDELEILVNGARGPEKDEIRGFFNVFMTVVGSEKTMASIKITLASNVQVFMDNRVRHATSGNDINFDLLRKEPTVVYVTVPFHQSSLASPIISVFYSQLFNFMQESTTDIPVYFLLDEFANIGKIPDVDKALATFRSKRVSISLGIQSIVQLENQYNKPTANVILDNLKTKVILPGLSFESAHYVRNMLGNRDVVVPQKHADQLTNIREIITTTQSKPLLNEEGVRQLGDGEMVVLIDNLKPFRDEQRRSHLEVDLKEKIVPTNMYSEEWSPKTNNNSGSGLMMLTVNQNSHNVREIDQQKPETVTESKTLHNIAKMIEDSSKIDISLASVFPFDHMYNNGNEKVYYLNVNQAWNFTPVLQLPEEFNMYDGEVECILFSIRLQIRNKKGVIKFENEVAEQKKMNFIMNQSTSNPRMQQTLNEMNGPIFENVGYHFMTLFVKMSGGPFSDVAEVLSVFPIEVNN